MLSSRASIDGGPSPAVTVQGFDHLHVNCRPRSVAPGPVHAALGPLDAQVVFSETNTTSAYPQYTSSTASPSSPGSHPRRDSYFNVDVGSPRIQSPLRQSISYTDAPDLGLASRVPGDHPEARPNSVDMSFTGDKRPGAADGGPRSRVPGWLGRTGNYNDGKAPTSPIDPVSTRARSSSTTSKVASSGGSSRFAFFANSVSAFKELTTSPVSVPQDDELMNLDIDSALFPQGSPNDGSAFSPAAYKNLQMTAMGLLSKFQIAYQQRTIEYRELKAERDAQTEEQDEVEIRVQHLKMQLEDMARKAAERESAMQSLLEELARERRSQMDDRYRRDKSAPVAPSEASALSEDLGAEEDQKKRDWRKSSATSKSDLSLDTDEESFDEASIFSRSRSPTIATTMSEFTPSPTEPAAPPPKPAMLGPPRTARASNTQMTAFQKLFKGISGESPKEPELAPANCRNCQGQEASIAWDTVSLLKDENKGLKTRVEELESAVESALDAVNGLVL